MKRELDIHVNAACREEDSIDYAIEIDFEGIFCEESPKQSTVIKDLLELEIATRNNSKTAITSLLKHPLVATYNICSIHLITDSIFFNCHIFLQQTRAIL